MKKFCLFYSFLSLLAVIFSGCSRMYPLTQKLLLLKDKDGIYVYDPATSQEKLIYKVDSTQVFAKQPAVPAGDAFTILIFAQPMKINPKNMSGSTLCAYEYLWVDLVSGTCRLVKKTYYLFFRTLADDHKVFLKNYFYDLSGKAFAATESLIVTGNIIRSYHDILINEDDPVSSLQSSTAADKTIFSLRGDLYFVKNKDTSLLAKYPGQFNLKFSGGFFFPAMHPDGKEVLFLNIPRNWFMDTRSMLMKADLESGLFYFVKDGQFNDIRYSKDGGHIVFSRYRENEPNLQVDIFVLDMKTLKEKSIGIASQAFWIQQ